MTIKELADYTPLINQTIKTLNEKDNITVMQRQQALKFYHWLEEYMPEMNQATRFKFKEYENLLRKKGVLRW